MNDKVFGVVSTISGLVVGWSLNELSYLFKSGRENRKVLNQVLFTQLEIRDVIRKTDLGQAEKQFNVIVSKRFPGENQAAIQEFVGKLFYEFIQNELNNKFSDKIKELGVHYKNYMATLSQIDPFVTYYISNKDIILDYLGYINDYLERLKEFLPKTTLSDGQKENEAGLRSFKLMFDKVKNAITPIIRKDALETIEEDILTVAKKINYLRYYQTKRYLNKTGKFQFNQADVKKMDAYFESVLGK